MAKVKIPAERTPEWEKNFIEDYWFNLGDTSRLKVTNPFHQRTQYDVENPHVFVLDLMRNPDYFYFTCKHLFGKELYPFQLAVLRELWRRPFPMLIGSRGMSKSFMLGVYAMLRALLCQGSKVCIVGAAFRQAKVVFNYALDIWEKSPLLRDLLSDSAANGPRFGSDMWVLRLGDSTITAIPLGDGSKVRGLRGSHLVVEEFASINPLVYETVIAGFAAVSASPVEKAKRYARTAAMKDLSLWGDAQQALAEESESFNQTIISGTAYYSFNHFCTYWRRYKAIVESRGDRKKLAEFFDGPVDDSLNWKDYSVIRLPVELLPAGFMDEKHIAKSKATMDRSVFGMEYRAIFADDSNGFYKASLVESCVVGRRGSSIQHPSCGEVSFSALLRGAPRKKYVLAVDPASENDNFSLVVLEIWPEHRRVVYCWTTNKRKHRLKLAKGLTAVHDYYHFAARKVRQVLKLFPCERLALDFQGGGVAVLEALQDPARLEAGERPLYPVIEDDDPKETDDYAGDHLVEIVQFARADWVSRANHGLRKDMEDKVLLFPEFDNALLGMAALEDEARAGDAPDAEADAAGLYDNLEDCMLEIEELKKELTTIVHTQTGVSGRDRWDTPEIKLAGARKGRLRKDRYSSLLMANACARDMAPKPAVEQGEVYGGFARVLSGRAPKPEVGHGWTGPQWFLDELKKGAAAPGMAVRRR